MDNIIYGKPITALSLVTISNKSGYRFSDILELIHSRKIQAVLFENKYYVSPALIPSLQKYKKFQEKNHVKGVPQTEK